ncbi:hypothetical protein PVAND_012415 [Polypedilum vanderplanki]|uniref:BTB domain-containing protein n=1 Tax=Polypedilum vanderplanki TaxID=319348 RepID=A0A9J6CLI8_POLVA|nr:hypothetical protein PVAND_012415 [Polypedilum vanderplanki]
MSDNNKQITERKILWKFNMSHEKLYKFSVEHQREIMKIQTSSDQLLNYGKFLNSTMYSDFTFVSLDNIENPVHRLVLISQSHVLEQLFETKFDFHMTKKAVIDLESETLLEMLRYIYTGQVENLDKKASVFITVAEKYELIGLKQICIASFIKTYR